MARQPPKRQLDPLKPSSANMAAARTAKPKAASKASPTNTKEKGQLHKRSRTGECFSSSVCMSAVFAGVIPTYTCRLPTRTYTRLAAASTSISRSAPEMLSFFFPLLASRRELDKRYPATLVFRSRRFVFPFRFRFDF